VALELFRKSEKAKRVEAEAEAGAERQESSLHLQGRCCVQYPGRYHYHYHYRDYRESPVEDQHHLIYLLLTSPSKRRTTEWPLRSG